MIYHGWGPSIKYVITLVNLCTYIAIILTFTYSCLLWIVRRELLLKFQDLHVLLKLLRNRGGRGQSWWGWVGVKITYFSITYFLNGPHEILQHLLLISIKFYGNRSATLVTCRLIALKFKITRYDFYKFCSTFLPNPLHLTTDLY